MSEGVENKREQILVLLKNVPSQRSRGRDRIVKLCGRESMFTEPF